MRVGTACKAFNCLHGAPFGNAGALDDLTGATQEDQGILDRIDRIANATTRVGANDGLVLSMAAFGYLARKSPIVASLAEAIVGTFAFLFTTGALTTMLLLFVLSAGFMREFRRFFRIPEVEMHDFLDGSAQGRIAERVFDVDNAVERRILEDVMRRSLVER